MTEPPMIFAKSPRILPDGCIHCGFSRTYCDANWTQRDENCCQACGNSERDSH